MSCVYKSPHFSNRESHFSYFTTFSERNNLFSVTLHTAASRNQRLHPLHTSQNPSEASIDRRPAQSAKTTTTQPRYTMSDPIALDSGLIICMTFLVIAGIDVPRFADIINNLLIPYGLDKHLVDEGHLIRLESRLQQEAPLQWETA